MAVGRRRIYPGIRMMNEMKFPHPFYFVLYPVDEPGTYEIQYHQTEQYVKPGGQWIYIQKTEVMLISIITPFYNGKSKGEIDHYRSERKENIQACMMHFIIPELKYRKETFDDPEK